MLEPAVRQMPAMLSCWSVGVVRAAREALSVSDLSIGNSTAGTSKFNIADSTTDRAARWSRLEHVGRVGLSMLASSVPAISGAKLCETARINFLAGGPTTEYEAWL